MRSEKRWVIVGKVGLYAGQSLTRAAMIREHIAALFGVIDTDVGFSAPLSNSERALWMQCQLKGDRALLAVITYDDKGFPTWTSENRSSESEPTPSENPSPTM